MAGQFIDGKWVNKDQGSAFISPDVGGSMTDVSQMSNANFNRFAMNNPEAARSLGEGGYTVSEANMKGIGPSGAATGSDFAKNLGMGAQVVGALSGLANAYTGLKGLKLAKEQFGFQKGLANRNLANQAKLINEQRLNSANVGLSLAGNTLTDADRLKTREKVAAGNVSGSAIG